MTDVSLKEHMDSRFDAMRIAEELGRKNLDIRLDAMNHFRQDMSKQIDTFVTKREHELIVGDIRELRESRAELAGMAKQSSVNFAVIVAFIGAVISIVSLVVMIVRG